MPALVAPPSSATASPWLAVGKEGEATGEKGFLHGGGFARLLRPYNGSVSGLVANLGFLTGIALRAMGGRVCCKRPLPLCPQEQRTIEMGDEQPPPENRSCRRGSLGDRSRDTPRARRQHC